jgi:hypothetical protein
MKKMAFHAPERQVHHQMLFWDHLPLLVLQGHSLFVVDLEGTEMQCPPHSAHKPVS